MADDCSVCVCDSGKTNCYTQHCPACPAGMRSIAEPGECCGTCQKGTDTNLHHCVFCYVCLSLKGLNSLFVLI